LLQALRPSVPNQQLQVEDHTLPTAGQQGRGYGDAAAAAAALQAAGKFSDGVAAASQPARGKIGAAGSHVFFQGSSGYTGRTC
jgi:hypothetical protein